MYRLLIVDDEEIITDGLFEVFSRFRPEQLDVCKAYSSKEALDWMLRTRIDIVLTDIAMPGMNGLELVEQVQVYWPRCKIVFLTGHSHFDYAYRAFQMPNVRYLLKTEGYGKVTEVIGEVIDEIDRSNQVSRLLQQSKEQAFAYELLAQGEYMRHLLQDSPMLCADQNAMISEFGKLNIALDSTTCVYMVLGRLSYPIGKAYSEKSEILAAIRATWEYHLSEQMHSLSIVDKRGDVVWFLQPSTTYVMGKSINDWLKYLEGTLEQVQEACLASLHVTIGFTIASECCPWESITPTYERLRKLQQFKIGDGNLLVLQDHPAHYHEQSGYEGEAPYQTAEKMAMHLEAGRDEEFLRSLKELSKSVLHMSGNVQRMIETYYSIAVLLYSYASRLGLHDQIDHTGKLMRLDDHLSMEEAFQYLEQTAEAIFHHKKKDERDRATQVIERICQYIEQHLSEDLSLVRLAEIHYFNPSYLSYFFKQELGINVSEYIDKCRLRKAKELLSDNSLKIWEVGEAVGYTAAHSFTRFFKRHTGLTPKQYRDTLS